MQFPALFAQAYGQGNYNTSTYNGQANTAASATSTGGSTGSGSILTNTGFDITLSATLACLIVLSALLIRFWKRPKKSRN